MPSLRAGLAALALICAAVPTHAQQNSYGGHDIVSLPGSEVYYDTARNWTVSAAQGPAGFAYCFAETDRDGVALRLGWDGLQWQLAVPVESSPDWQGVLQIDGAGSGQGYMSGGDYISGTAVGGWTIAWLGMAELDGLQQGKIAVLGVGRGDFNFSLAGSTAAVLKVQECVGNAGARTAAAQPAADEPTEASVVPYASVGSWVVNAVKAGSDVLACEAYDPSRPYLHFEIDSTHSHIDMRDGGPMHPLGERVALEIGFVPGSGPEPYVAEMIEGRDGNAWARMSEGRADGPGLLDDAFQNASQVSVTGQGILLEADLSGTNQALAAFFQCSNDIQ